MVNGNPYLVSEIVIETHRGADVEWVNDPVHNGNESMRMYFTANYGHALIQVPYHQPLSSIESVYFTVKYTHARPRFALTLDMDDNGIADTLLLSDYSKDGNGRWTQLWGGSRWGWDKTDYPMTTYGGPWQPLSKYVSAYPEVNVLGIGIVAEYWAFDPEGVDESLYVDGVEINGIYYDFESSGVTEIQPPEIPAIDVVFSLQPEIIECPLFDDEKLENVIKANLHVANVVGLQRFTWEMEYDSEYLEYWDVKIGSEVREQTEGSHRSGSSVTLMRSFTGSGILLEFYFIPKMISSSEFKVYDIHLYDSMDRLISTGRSTCEIRVIPFDEWVDGEYEALSEEFDEKITHLSELQQNFTHLQESYIELESLNEQLHTNNTELQNQINTIESNMQDLTTQIDELQSEVERLESQQIPGFPLVSLIIGIVGLSIIAYIGNRRGL